MRTKTEIDNVIVEVQKKLSENTEWITRYKEYATQLKEDKKGTKYNECRKRFRVAKPLYVYTNVSKAKSSTCDYDLRFGGQSVGTIKVRKDDVFFTTKDKQQNNEMYFGSPVLSTDDHKWNSPEGKMFRKHFTTELLAKKGSKSPEHALENELLVEFSKKKSVDKKLCYIQPVKLLKNFFQMPTPLSASKNDISYQPKGGGIDILARITMDGVNKNNGRLSVIELKDENKNNEPPEKVIKQAIAYAIFLGKLLYSESGEKWYSLFGFKSKRLEKMTLNVVAAMPFKENQKCSFENQTIDIDEHITLELHTLFIKIEANDIKGFSGSLVNTMRKK
ncbi:hypothetical protein M2137_001032 [Parabacteroides sp. PFB2-10]|uniref:hypothetical protein n=1 Tax=Parabacteroides sp. PFB2-10 TaxID=1742405 RepID=UPI002473804F|nr:hypothetical protein [Parabacteroides sp. PFB2-10]MDH6312262.1 hypothetical protein [Parabacteroides sp. PFB2-10]